MIRWLVCLLPLALSACSCPPEPELRRYADLDFRTPESCLEYFRRAILSRDAYHVRLALSEELCRKDGVRLDVLHTYIEEAIEKLENRVGPIEDIEIDDATYQPGRPWLANVLVEGKDRQRETVFLVLQTTAWVTYTDGRAGDLIELDPFTPLDRATSSDARLTDKAIYRVEYEQGWRILGVTNTGIGKEMQDYLRELEKRSS